MAWGDSLNSKPDRLAHPFVDLLQRLATRAWSIDRRQSLDRHHHASAPGGQFVLHAKTLPGNPYDGHTLGSIIDATEKLTRCAIYRGHDTANPRRVFISGQKRGDGAIERELRRRSAIEPVIGHMKTDGHLGRCQRP